MPVSHETIRTSRASPWNVVGRYMAVLALAFSAWAFVVGLSAGVFSRQVAWSGHEFIPQEVLGFTCAFSVAAAVTGMVALATFGNRRWAIGFAAGAIAVLSATVPALRWLTFAYTAPNRVWGQRLWDNSFELMWPSFAVGLSMALVISSVVLLSVHLSRRLAHWQFGILVAATVAVLGIWVFPITISLITDQSIPYLRWHYGYRYDDALRGAATGAGVGALSSAIMLALVARSFAPSNKE